jgi:hypothetical protein
MFVSSVCLQIVINCFSFFSWIKSIVFTWMKMVSNILTINLTTGQTRVQV